MNSDQSDAVNPQIGPAASGASSRRGPRSRRIAISGLVLLLVVASCWFGYRWYLESRTNWGVVVPGKIYRSAIIPRSLLRNKLQANQIRVIVFLSRDTDNDPDLAAERALAKEMGIEYLNFPMSGDGVAPPGLYPQAVGAVCKASREGKPVLIHCHSGAQRTGGVVATYRVLVEGWSAEKAGKELRRYGHDPRKNSTLIPFLNANIKEWAQTLVEMKMIDRVPSPIPQFTP